MKKIRGQEVIDPAIRIQRNSYIDFKTGCWNWAGTMKGKSKLKRYGSLTIGSRSDGSRRQVSAHRYSYEVFVGFIPEGMFVCHKCDNPSCVNPDHLFTGTRQDNIDDREVKGRNKPRDFGKHEQHPNAILSWKDVKAIRSKYNKIRGEIQALADQYKVDRKTVSDIVNMKTWIPAPPEKGK